ncbi:unnamed protein product [Heterobilharzia americana]|nr:unnamed protein product [Heterobilharzia americana]
MPDDARVCDFCLTTLFLSGVSCSCVEESNTIKENIGSTSDHSSNSPNPTTRKRGISDQLSMNESSEEERRPPSHMVCLKHVSELCDKCPHSVFVLNYHYSIDELSNLEQCLAERLAHFYSWKNQLSVLIQPNDSSSLNNHFIKKEPVDKQDTTSDTQSNNSTLNTITLEELQMKLTEGYTAGYHTDEIYDEAQSMLDRGKHLQQICARLKSSIIGTGNCNRFRNPSIPLSSSTIEAVRFQTRRPATFSVATSSNNTCPTSTRIIKVPSNQGYVVLNHELDVNKFISAVNQTIIESVNNMATISSDTINLLCNLILMNATRSISTTFSLSDHLTNTGLSSDYLSKNFHLLSADDQALLLLDYLLEELRSEFPVYVYRIPEWNSLDLLRHALRWLCVCSRYDNTTKCIHWSLLHLRYYLALGEEIISQLTANTSCSHKPHSRGSHISTPSGTLHVWTNQTAAQSLVTGINASGVDTALTQILRFMLARMHTSLGKLTQLSVQAETLISNLTEILNSSRSSTYQEIESILSQFKNLGIDHLTAINRQIVLPDEPQLHTALDERSFCSILDIQSVTSSEDVIQLKALVKQRIDNMINCCTREGCSLSTKHPQLTEAEIICDLGAFFSSSSTSDHVLNLVTTNQKIVVLSDIFSRHLTKLNELVSNTKRAIQDLYCKVYPHRLSSHDIHMDSLLEILLPIISTTNQKCLTVQSFKDTCLSGCENASSSENSLITSCSLCSLFVEDSSVYPTFDWFVNFERFWSISVSSHLNNEEVIDLTKEEDDRTYGSLLLLDNPVSFALRFCLDQIREHFVELKQLLQVNENQLNGIFSTINKSLMEQLPNCLINFVKHEKSISYDDNDDVASIYNSSDFIYKLNKIFCILLTFKMNLIPYIEFIEYILASLLNK